MTTCKNCYGKGYSTELEGNTLALADFIGDKTAIIRQSGIRIRLCSCNRGKDLDKYFTIKEEFNL